VRTFGGRPVYVVVVVMCETVGVRHRLRVVWRGESVDKWKGVFSTVYRYVVWVRSNF
jgi:hypothetical protein